MRLAVGTWRMTVALRIGAFFCLLPTAYCQLSCSIPNLESQQCSEARDAVKEFYSFHFGNDMRPSIVNLEQSKRFLTPELIGELSTRPETTNDYFTATDNYPKAFRVGVCRASSASEVTIQVVLFWKDDTRSEQKEVIVNTIKQGDKWLINKVESGLV